MQPFEMMDDAMAEILSRKTEVERLMIAGRMWQSARTILRGAIVTEHPDWSVERVNREIARRISHGAIGNEASEMQPHQLMQRVADACERLGIAYWVVGSMASMVYGEPRFTNDVDIVVDLAVEKVPAFAEAFPSPDYYCPESSAREAVTFRFQFNILHPESGLKADIIIPPETDFSRSEARRVRRISNPGEFSALFGSPEDVLLNKLVYYRIGGGVSDKHIRDIAGMLKLQKDKLDFGYIAEWSAKLDVVQEWNMVRERVGLG